MEIQCPAPDCGYKTQKMDPQYAMQQLTLHNAAVHGCSSVRCKPESLKRPLATLDMSEGQWRDFSSQWSRYSRSTGLSGQDAVDQLMCACSDPLRLDMNSESGTKLNSMNEEDLLKAMESIAVRKSNPMVHRNKLQQMRQGENELFRNYVSRLKEAAIDCKFSIQCSKEGCDTTITYADEMIRDQAVYGVYSSDIQAKMLADGAVALPSLHDITVKAESEEQAQHSQAKIKASHHSEVTARRATEYKASKVKDKTTDQSKPCSYCGLAGHGTKPSRDKRASECQAWGMTCENCGKKGHFRSVCKSHQMVQTSSAPQVTPVVGPMPAVDATFGTLPIISGIQEVTPDHFRLAHVEWSEDRGWYDTNPRIMPKIKMDIEVMAEESATLYPNNHKLTPQRTNKLHAWRCTPDSGAQVTISGPTLMSKLNVLKSDLIPVSQKISTASDTEMEILGAIIIRLTTTSAPTCSTLQLCYIAKQCHGTYLSLSACTSLGIMHKNFPDPLPKISSISNVDVKTHSPTEEVDLCKQSDIKHQFPLAPCGCPIRATPPSLPNELPCESSDTKRLKQWILERYAASAFNTCCTQPLPAMHGDPLIIALKPGTSPSAIHVPAPVPIHYQEEVKKGLDRDVSLGVLEKVPVNTPVEWLHRMVIAPKKDGTPRRTVDLQTLNRASIRQTHHTASPFHTASSIPTNVKKTCLDAWNGYHSVLLEEGSRKTTSFITPWGVYRYRTAPQGYLASGDAYTHRYDNIVKDFRCIAKCVDDVCLWGGTNEENFFRTCQYLDLCSKNGIVFNPHKFVFSQSEIEFLGFNVTMEGLKPAAHLLQSIRDFPVPKDISGIRSFFGLINQVSYAFSMTKAMTPFRELLKPSTPFYWDEILQGLFDDAKAHIINEITEGVRMFDKERVTCLATDWSKLGIGYFLSQKHCDCSEITPICCTDGWKLVLAGSRFTKPAENRYHPVEGEALAVAYGLDKTRYYVLGCKKLIVATDHRPLLKIFGDRNLEDITNPRILSFKEKTLQFTFQVVYVPGHKHKAPDTMSRHPSPDQDSHEDIADMSDNALLNTIRATENEAHHLSDPARLAAMVAIHQVKAISVERIEHETALDPTLQGLMNTIQNGFPACKDLCPIELREYFRYREDLSISEGVILYKTRVLIPKSLRREVLQYLHSAHQGVQGMKSRAAETIFWPGISASIKDVRARCRTCNTIAPSQPAEPPITAEPPQYPFEQVCVDYFELGGIQYLAMADRYSGWLSVKCFARGNASANTLVSTLREWFMIFGAPKELASDGGPAFMAEVTQSFMKNWGIRHRLSSVAFPHSNCRAEVAVKTAKRLIRDNVGPHGSLDTDKFACALMQYRNTPLQAVNLSPAQILLGRRIRDFFPFVNSSCKLRKEWRITADDREKALARRHVTQREQLSMRAHELKPLDIGESVLMQNQTGNHPIRWDRTGIIVEKGPGPRQYYVRADGSGRISLRNRRFLRKCNTFADSPYPHVVTDDEQRNNTLGDLQRSESITNPTMEEAPTPPSGTDNPATETDTPFTGTDKPVGNSQSQDNSNTPSPSTPVLRRSERHRKPPERYGDIVEH